MSAAPTGGAGTGGGTGLDVETIVQGIVATATRKMILVRQEFEPIEPTTNDMLQWEDSRHKYAQIQELPGGELARIGTVGDGNCLLHSFLFALSPTYRSHNKAARSYIADDFRNILIARADELRTLADVTYPEIGGAVALSENFEILEGAREELNIEMAPLIAQLYGFNLLAVQVRSDMSLHPVCATHIAYNPALPTVLVNYIGGGLDIGNGGEGFQSGGHYEAIFAPILVPVEESSIRIGRKKKVTEPRVALDNVRTRYIFRHSEMGDLLAQFEIACRPELSAEAAALKAVIAARNAPNRNRSTRKRSSSNRNNTRKRTNSNTKKKTTSQ
jgi:hypothetical protein